MSDYTPYLIADFKTGYETDKEPWLLPQDAFKTLFNAYLHKGVLTKRLGYTEFGRLSHKAVQDYTGYVEVDVAANRVAVIAAKITVTDLDDDEDVAVYKDFGAGYFDGDDVFELDFQCTDGAGKCGLWALTQDINGIGNLISGDKHFLLLYQTTNNRLILYARHSTSSDSDSSVELAVDGTDYYLTIRINRTAGTLTCTIYSDTTRGTVVDTLSVDLPDATDTYQYLYGMQAWKSGGGGFTWDGEIRNLTIITYPGYAVMGIWDFFKANGSQYLLVFDTKRLHQYNATGERFEDISESDTWTGGDSNFFWCENYIDKIFMVNNVDQIRSYDGTTIAAVTADTDDDAVNDVDTCLLMFNYKERLVLLRTTENGTAHPQRARWPKAGGTDFTNDGYVDAPTVEWIMGADFIGDDLVVFFERSIWILKYTGDATLPFRWEQIAITEGCYATFSLMSFSDEILAQGPTSLIGCDAINVYQIDQKIPDLILTFNPSKLEYCYAANLDELRQAWLSYASQSEDYPDRVLCLNYAEKSFAIYDVAMHVFGYYNRASDLTLDDIDEAFDDIEWAFDDKEMQAGYPITLGGDRNGYIYYMNYSGSDGGSDILFDVESGRWNPYTNKGQQARLGYIDFLVEVDDDVSISVAFYLDQELDPYQTLTLDFSGTREKEWKRLYSGAIGAFHRIRMYHTASNQTVRIHAIMPYFRPAGRIV